AKVLEDDDRQARRVAAVALGSTRRKDAALALVDALLDEDESVREAATGSAALLFGEEAERIAGLEPLRRGRAVARLRAHVAASAELPETAEDGRLGWTGRNGTSADASEQTAVACRTDAPEEPVSFPRLMDGEPAMRFDHELDEDVLAVMHALSLARASSSVAGPEESEAISAPGEREDPADALVYEAMPDVPTESRIESAWAERSVDPHMEPEPIADGPDSLARDADLSAGPGAALADGAQVDGDAEPAGGGVDAEDDGARAAAHGAGPEFDEIESILRAALRGATPEDLASELGLSALALGPVLDEHLDAGRIVRRGKKLFLP
ncbi:MAG TPA: hypothetical protein VGD74_08170, partial [Vulgatibacter sp.]